ncbi:MAG: hypothetical protein UU73_C0004G0033 [Candidatus Daviesbacteria bacterium GW2011_GWA1_41_61]|uniref:EfeO-type cupredoxin-like domain-containing protein n=1 Tax=Candidatus Daviesbacteria bacterium GW2011_GWA2_40_9 TaxID=1618424 RepID=A0A0G0X6R3_9BACT|nr:MAG: hypothetical protein UU26_C0011G0002 [Candidatus Daviesbacteria bacterium GW2011_GWC1_40_9]KKR83332.1 MAG: hypothetical protein UU29_C0006G0021 [Candidatus Daviesbacteria bacterium GW2011_GWA2_40_9]KKR93237.1 MAG: hypothetical protein UU44_C0003G0033 [Candidatus Daviesbacteria bacterium GW2011_GWB1_41_15]KKS14725.1 MAG: hypothetical protein UU73_C0004G0033 [Candidatus Daviesbacteria bacterium GW2011_GWA1_41_61]
MRRKLKNQGFSAIILLVLIAAISILLIYFYYFKSSGKIEEWVKKYTPQTSKSEQTVVETNVKITKEGFVPQIIKVKIGTEVTWINEDKNSHQVISDLEGLDSDEPLLANDSFSFKFEKTGTFSYYDDLNPQKFKGTVVVE